MINKEERIMWLTSGAFFGSLTVPAISLLFEHKLVYPPPLVILTLITGVAYYMSWRNYKKGI